MSEDRRTSIRRRIQLPFRYATIEADATSGRQCDVLGVPRAVGVRAQLGELDDEFARLLAGVSDLRTQDAMRALGRKLSVLEEMLLADLPVPPAAELALSADGIGFEISEPIPIGSRVAVHLVLPVNYHLITAARVIRCAPLASAAGQFGVGAEFQGMDEATARRLTRFTIGREPAAH